MVAIAKSKLQEFIEGQKVACPQCSARLLGRSVSPASTDRYGRTTRRYFGWCIDCSAGFEVIQFRQGDKWAIHKYRYYAAVLTGDKPIPARHWVVVADLPKPPLAVIGPGGDYDRQIQV